MAPPRKVRRTTIPELETDMPFPAHNIIRDIGESVLGFAAATAQGLLGGGGGGGGGGPPPFQTDFPPQPVSGNGVCPPGFQVAVDHCTGQIVCKKTRKRRKRLLTCSDKADIAFITGTLGKGAMAQTAISALLARCG